MWISTHPDSKERAAEIIAKKKEYTFQAKPILSTSWDDVKKIFDEAGDQD